MATTTAHLVPPSALTTLIDSSVSSTTSEHPQHLHALALTVQHNLQHQHDWRSLQLHTDSPYSTSNSPLPRPLISGIPPRRVYTHPDMQLELIRKGLSEEDVEPERIWVVPSALREKWTLRRFAECFEGVPTPFEGRKLEAEKDGEDGEGDEKEVRKWAGDDVKRVLLATVDDDSTVVYYVVHDGIVKPRQN